jgi:hypothetical protein
VTEPLPEETDQAPHETMVAHSQERNIDESQIKVLDFQNEYSESSLDD